MPAGKRMVVRYRFDLRTLQIFISVVELSSITRAAKRENIASSAVSKRIADLEQDLGVELLYRQTRGVEPTQAGLALLRHARSIIQGAERLTGELSQYSKGVRGNVRMLVNKSAMVQFLPDDLRSFLNMYPDVRIDLQEEYSPRILSGIIDGSADIGVFTAGSGDPGTLETLEYKRDRLVLIVPRGHALAGRDSVRFTEAVGYDLVALASDSAWNEVLTRAAAEVGTNLNIRFRVASFDAVCRMVAADLGIAVGPQGMLRAVALSGLVEVGLDEPWAKRRLMVAVRDLGSLSAAARFMVKHLVSGRTELSFD
jgi:DNA-binding transcriptional LysR family regulator